MINRSQYLYCDLSDLSGLLKKLLPGDVVLADHGFNIGDSVGFYCASLQIPAFTKGRKQLCMRWQKLEK